MPQNKCICRSALTYAIGGGLLMLLGGSLGMLLGFALGKNPALVLGFPAAIQGGIAFFIGRKASVPWALAAALVGWIALVVPGLKTIAGEQLMASIGRGLISMVSAQLLFVALLSYIGKMTRKSAS